MEMEAIICSDPFTCKKHLIPRKSTGDNHRSRISYRKDPMDRIVPNRRRKKKDSACSVSGVDAVESSRQGIHPDAFALSSLAIVSSPESSHFHPHAAKDQYLHRRYYKLFERPARRNKRSREIIFVYLNHHNH